MLTFDPYAVLDDIKANVERLELADYLENLEDRCLLLERIGASLLRLDDEIILGGHDHRGEDK